MEHFESKWISIFESKFKTSLVAQMVKLLSTMQETRVWSLGWEDPLEKEMAIRSSTIAWKIPWTEEPDRLQPMGWQRVGHDWATSLSFTFLIQIQSVHSKGDESQVFFGRNDAKAETPILWPLHAKSWLIGKDSHAGRDWRQEEKGTTEDEMAGWHHWLDGRESGWTPGVGDGQGGLACCGSWGRKELDTTEWLNWTELNLKQVYNKCKGTFLGRKHSNIS